MENMYIHIPFCNKICSYCDFCKVLYQNNWADDYLLELEKEIYEKYKGEEMATIYIGGGTPSSLSTKQLTKLFEIINKIKLKKDYEFTFEANPESLTKEKLLLLQANRVNRISLGVQSFDNDILKILKRAHTKEDVLKVIDQIKKNGINNINIDLIYGFRNQNISYELENIEKLNIPHVSTYSLILEEHTELYINGVDLVTEDEEYEMYKQICNKLDNHYEISNFGKESKHNMNYWNNNEYYGFGLGAHGYVNNVRYENTRSINKYLSGDYLLKSYKVTPKENIENEIMLGLRKIKGINIEAFELKFNKKIEDIINIELLERENNYLFIKKDNLYIMNEILIKLFK